MDDLALDTTTPEAQQKQATLKEMARRSQDRIRVYNPLDEDYTVRFDSIGFVIPNRNKDNGHGMGVAVVFRYVAQNYLTQMIDLLLTSKLDDAVKLENERRAKLGMLPMTKFIGGEELMFTQSLRTDNQEARRRLVPVIWLGLAERYGTEAREESISGKPKDDRPLDERLLTEIENQPSVMPQKAVDEEKEGIEDVSENVAVSQPLEDLKTKDVFTLHKIAKEKGIEVEKTAKKDELIKAISQ